MLAENNINVNNLIDEQINTNVVIRNQTLEFSTTEDSLAFKEYQNKYKKYSLAQKSGQAYVVTEKLEDGVCKYDYMLLSSFKDYNSRDYFKIVIDTKFGPSVKEIEFSKLWLKEYDLSIQYDDIVFNLDPKFQPGKSLNLWRGFIKSNEGDASPFVNHFKNLIIGTNDEIDYVLKLIAWTIQYPHLTPGVLLLLKGPQGCGKSTIYTTIKQFCPNNHYSTSDIERLLKFNGQTGHSKFIALEEAFCNGQASIKNKLKHLITGEERTVESKGVNAYEIKNVVFYIATSNDERPISIDEDDRRTAVFNCKLAGNDKYFIDYYKWLECGGAAIALNYLQKLDLSNFNRRSIPNNQAKADLKSHSLKTDDKFILEFLCGTYDFELGIDDWDNPIQIDRNALYDLYADKTKFSIDSRRFSATLQKIFGFPDGWADNWKRRSKTGPKIRFYKFEDNNSCRAAFASHCKTTEESLFGS